MIKKYVSVCQIDTFFLCKKEIDNNGTISVKTELN